MDYATVLALIQTWIVANGNNEITANVLRPILEAMLQQPNDLIGVLDDLDTADKTNIVAAINDVLTSNVPAATALRSIDTTGVDFDQSELQWVQDAINQTIASNGDFTCENGEMMVFFCDVLMASSANTIVSQRRYYRLTTGASVLTTIPDVFPLPLMPDGVETVIVDVAGSLVIDLGDIAAADVWTAFNADGSEPFTMNDDKFVIAVQNGDQKVWKWVGGTGSFGNSATPSVATDFVDLTDAANNPPPVSVDYKPLKLIATTPYTLLVEDFNRLLVFSSNDQEVTIPGTLVEEAVDAGVQSLRLRTLFLGTGTHDVTDPDATEYNYSQNAKVDIECYEVDSTGLWVLKEIGGEGAGDMTKAVYDPNTVEADAFATDNMFAPTVAKTTPVDADTMTLWDSAAAFISKEVTWANIKAALASATQTLTNKRITMRVQSVVSSATVTPNADNDDAVKITAQATALTLANPSGTPTSMQPLTIRIKDNGTARAITYGAQYRAIGVSLPNSTVISKTTYIGMIWNSDDSKWDVVGTNTEV